MNWGYKILCVYIGFVGMMSTFVFIASKQTNEMQDENYYVSELHYQDIIDGKNNVTALHGRVRIIDSATAIKIQIPQSASGNISDGKARFLRPSDQTKDKNLVFAPNENGVQTFDHQYFAKGLYAVQISWKSNGKLYFAEDKIFVSKW